MGTGKIAKVEVRQIIHHPFAGITLFRFNGYFSAVIKTAPREIAAKIKVINIVTFFTDRRIVDIKMKKCSLKF